MCVWERRQNSRGLRVCWLLNSFQLTWPIKLKFSGDVGGHTGCANFKKLARSINVCRTFINEDFCWYCRKALIFEEFWEKLEHTVLNVIGWGLVYAGVPSARLLNLYYKIQATSLTTSAFHEKLYSNLAWFVQWWNLSWATECGRGASAALLNAPSAPEFITAAFVRKSGISALQSAPLFLPLWKHYHARKSPL